MSGFDIDNIKFEEEGTEMPILHPVTFEPLRDDKGAKVTLRLAGMDSAIYRKAQNAIANKRTKGARMIKLTAERLAADSMEVICKCTLGWSSNLLIKGKVPKTAEEIYTSAPWIKDQAETWIHDRANYLGN